MQTDDVKTIRMRAADRTAKLNRFFGHMALAAEHYGITPDRWDKYLGNEIIIEGIKDGPFQTKGVLVAANPFIGITMNDTALEENIICWTAKTSTGVNGWMIGMRLLDGIFSSGIIKREEQARPAVGHIVCAFTTKLSTSHINAMPARIPETMLTTT
ncbi:MAG: hypothetical protein KAS32_01775 [Candidatus Peribacteraceae bacterium]|nr:hypothetical protein [Candidatus Peribacteraceae bacterium]